MTLQSEVISNPNYIPVLDHGFVGLVDFMGSDSAIVQAARVSYGEGTKRVNEDRGLIRYLMRNQHSSPIEMCEVKFAIKLPIFVMRQLIRTRTASTNEYSGRYSIMSDEFYIPDALTIQPQSTDNKQGRAGDLSPKTRKSIRWLMQAVSEHCNRVYRLMLGQRDTDDVIYDAYDADDPLFDQDFPGIARELARTVLPVSNYTECYWKIDLSNLFKFLKLRRDSHAQYEIRVYADAMYDLIQPIFPLACEAAEDYLLEAHTMSRMDMALLRDIVAHPSGWSGLMNDKGNDEKRFSNSYGMSLRELRDLKSELGISP